jgi:hypothetical protein
MREGSFAALRMTAVKRWDLEDRPQEGLRVTALREDSPGFRGKDSEILRAFRAL